MARKIFRTLFTLTFLSLFIFTAPGLWANAGPTGVWQKFSEFDPESEGVIDYGAWNRFLQGTVMQVGRSTRVLGYARKETYRLSRITFGDNSPSRFEGNRLLAHVLGRQEKKFVHKYLESLEALPERVPLAWLSRDQQLAYWLNLYNAAVIDKVIGEYPISNLKGLRDPDDPGSFWFQKNLMVEGVKLSLKDIEDILIHNWDNPLVIYGLWQGAIGGPTLSNEAYTGENVWKILKYNGFEFINSNRGVRVEGNEAEISIYYAWMSEVFDNSDDVLLRHIRQLADPGFLEGIHSVTEITSKYYDWMIADLIGGSYHSGQSNKGTANAGAASAVAGGPVLDFAPRGIPPIPVSEKYPPQAIKLITGILKNNDIPERIPIITTEECAPDEPCEYKPRPSKDDKSRD